ncbi:MAG: hypothetical protein HY331_15815 [Chloroflexi bacterium]|nr:hypothetical protein [Chloroflexota bacterium]
MKPKPDYASYFIRLWRDQTLDREWTVQIEHIQSGEQRYFASLEDLFAFLRAQLPGGRKGDARKEDVRKPR